MRVAEDHRAAAQGWVFGGILVVFAALAIAGYRKA
jgi:hypothetical protein